MSRVFVIGIPAGMLSAIMVPRKGHQVELFEKNEKLGKSFIHRKGKM